MSTIDLDYRPSSYFWSIDHGVQLASDIPGVARRRMYERALAIGDSEAAERLMAEAQMSRAQRRDLGSLHPSLMGGEYLPRRKPQEVEIARIVIASTTYDTICVNARRIGNRIAYRVVDEYEGMCLDKSTRTSTKPLSLGQLFDFFIQGWNLWACLSANFAHHGYPIDRVEGFIVDASSSYYAEFGDLVAERVTAWAIEQRQIHAIEEESDE